MKEERDDFDESREERLYDEYLDAAMRGEFQDPTDFCESRGGSPEVREWIEGIHRMLAPGAGVGGATDDDQAVPFERLGEFRLLKRVGEGGMGVVYLAEQTSLKRLVALKVIRPELAASPVSRARFEREAQAIAKLMHPNIVAIYDYGKVDDVTYLAMEFVAGQSLLERMSEAKKVGDHLAIVDVLKWMSQVARALASAHDEGILHRDVKPSNIRITEEGEARLLDFGLAREMEADGPTLTRSFAGSPSYASPEQISLESRSIDAKSDVYSLGATLYEALTGRVPFEDETLERLMHRILVSDVTPPSKFNPGISRELETVVLKAMERAPERRYDSASSFADDLDAILSFRPIKARPPSWPNRLFKWCRRNRLAAASAAGTLLVVVAVGLILLLQGEARRVENLADARELVEDATSILDEVEALREKAERASWVSIRLSSQSQERWLSPAEEERLRRSDDLVEENETGREIQLAQVLRQLSQAQRLDPEAPGMREAWAAFYYQKWLDAQAGGQLVAATYRESVESFDDTGKWVRKLVGPASITMESSPPGAVVHLFQYREQSDILPDGEHRLVPIPLESPNQTAPLRPGSWCLEVLEDCDGLQRGDLVVRVGEHEIEGAILVSEGTGDVLPTDRLVSIDGEPVQSLFDVERLESSRPDEGGRRYVFWADELGDETRSLEGNSLEELQISVRSPSGLIEVESVPAEVYTQGRFVDVDLPKGLLVRRTANPLLIPSKAPRQTPLQNLSLDTGAYLAVFDHPDRALVRVPFHVDHPTKPYHHDIEINVDLPKRGDVPSGFVPIAIDATGGNHSEKCSFFWIQDHEVTCAEYATFLNDPEILAEIKEKKDRRLYPTYPKRDRDGDRWRTRRGIFYVPSVHSPKDPVIGVSWNAASEYVAWKNRQEPVEGYEYGLPTFAEWSRVIYGEMSRLFVYGNHFRAKWQNSYFSRRWPGPEPVGSYPTDESPYGVFDLAGSASEWCQDAAHDGPDAHHLLVGGAWTQMKADEFRNALSYWYAPDVSLQGSGFRLVLRKRH